MIKNNLISNKIKDFYYILFVILFVIFFKLDFTFFVIDFF